jgi:superfamily II DNA or RNA helicase
MDDALRLRDDENSDDVECPRRLMAYLIASGRLELRFAFARHVDEAELFHPKFGIFDLPNGDKIAFTGSANETDGGHRRNFESIDVFRSWDTADVRRVEDKAAEFHSIWEGLEQQHVEVVSLSEDALARVREWSERHPPEEKAPKANPTIDDGLWPHQRAAVAAFLKDRRGILEMATGTGKTRTALHLCRHLVATDAVDSIIVSTYGTDLLDQWAIELAALADNLGYALTRRYGGEDTSHFFSARPAKKILLCARGQLAPVLRGLPQRKRERLFLIHDEVHKLGSEANRDNLDGAEVGITWRLGLSATPDREYDAEGNAFVARHIGEILFRFPLEEAIRAGILAPFDYLPIEWRTSDDDREKIKAVFKLQAAKTAEGHPLTQEQIWTRLSAVYKASPTKLPHFRYLLTQRPDVLYRSIIFIADKAYADLITPLVFERTKRYHTYFEGDEKEHLTRFSRGDLDCLIACHRVSEGIDVRSIRSVVLLSADRARLETIQRIGRCLRRDPKDPLKQAIVVDFIRLPDGDKTETSDTSRRDWLIEVSRTRPEQG